MPTGPPRRYASADAAAVAALPMGDTIDLVADLNAQDDDGLGWSTLVDALAPERVRPGTMLAAARDGHPRAYGSILLSAARSHLADQVRHRGSLAAAPVESTAASTVGDPVAALQDLERAVKVVAEIPALRLAAAQAPHPPGRRSIHEEHVAAMHSGFMAPPQERPLLRCEPTISRSWSPVTASRLTGGVPANRSNG